jgi:hypothetical protein
MTKGERVPNRSDHEAACPQAFKETPKPVQKAAAPKKSKKKNKMSVEVVEEVAEEGAEDESLHAAAERELLEEPGEIECEG